MIIILSGGQVFYRTATVRMIMKMISTATMTTAMIASMCYILPYC